MVILNESKSRAVSWPKIYYSHSKKCVDAGKEAINTIALFHDQGKTEFALERIAFILEQLPPEKYSCSIEPIALIVKSQEILLRC